MSCEVFVAGSLHLDVMVSAPSLPRPDETLMGDAVNYAFGGKGGNQAVAAARMGATTAMAGQIGRDAFGDQIAESLAASGVDFAQVRHMPGVSGMSVAIVDGQGSYGAVVVSGVNQTIAAGDIDLPQGARLLVLQNEIPEKVNLDLARRARKAGARVLLNAAPARPTDPALLELVDILVVNRIEAGDMTGLTDPAAQASALAGTGPPVIVITLGEDGVFCSAGGTVSDLPAYPAKVVSTHGAGDMFVGALAARLSTGEDLPAALDFAQAAAALHVSSPVARRAGIDLAQVTAFQTASR